MLEDNFNSTMVRLKAPVTLNMRHALVNFNSTMVRLKAGEILESDPITIFQFHYGTIKSQASSLLQP